MELQVHAQANGGDPCRVVEGAIDSANKPLVGRISCASSEQARTDDKLPVSPPTGPPEQSAEGVPPSGRVVSPDRGGVPFLRQELSSARRTVRELQGSVETLSLQLGDANTEIGRLRVENAALRARSSSTDPRDTVGTIVAPVLDAVPKNPPVVGSPDSGLMDPVKLLGPELSALIFLQIHADRIGSLHRWTRVSSAWNVALIDDALWQPLCHSTWSAWRWAQNLAARGALAMWRQCFTDAHWAAVDGGITAEELIQRRWGFEFKDDQSGLIEATAAFFEDGHFVTTVPSAPSARQPLPYQLCNGPLSSSGWAGIVAADPYSAYRFVQVKRYPQLRVSRVGWRWRLENDMVALTELD